MTSPTVLGAICPVTRATLPTTLCSAVTTLPARLSAGHRGDVVGDRLDLLRRQLAAERRHRALPVRHALDDERAGRLRGVEVGSDGAVRAGVAERVARRAARGQED